MRERDTQSRFAGSPTAALAFVVALGLVATGAAAPGVADIRAVAPTGVGLFASVLGGRGFALLFGAAVSPAPPVQTQPPPFGAGLQT